MDRRMLLRYGGRAAALAPFWAAMPALSASGPQAAGQTASPGVLRRIGITTVCFRDRFAATRGKNEGAVPAGQELTLLTAPKFIAETLGLHNVEIWSAQFADQSLDYCRQIKAAARMGVFRKMRRRRAALVFAAPLEIFGTSYTTP